MSVLLQTIFVLCNISIVYSDTNIRDQGDSCMETLQNLKLKISKLESKVLLLETKTSTELGHHLLKIVEQERKIAGQDDRISNIRVDIANQNVQIAKQEAIVSDRCGSDVNSRNLGIDVKKSKSSMQNASALELQVQQIDYKINEVYELLYNITYGKVYEADASSKCTNQTNQYVNSDFKSVMNDNLDSIVDRKVMPIDCQDIKTYYPASRSWTYNIYPTNKGSMRVFCDMDTDGGGWTVFQSRKDGTVDFHRTWEEYKAGFGNLTGEFWLGNEKIYTLLSRPSYTLRADMQDFDGVWKFAKYSQFALSGEDQKYKITIGGYSGTAGDSLSEVNYDPFSTKDSDNDNWNKHCAQLYRSGFWFNACYRANPNGYYYKYPDRAQMSEGGIIWKSFKGYQYSLKTFSLKIKRN